MPRQSERPKLVPLQRPSIDNKRINNYTDLGLVGYNIDDIDAVVNAVKNLFSIMIGEVPFNRALGSNLRDYLFRPITKSTSISVMADLTSTLGRFEPRVKLHSSSKVIPDPDNRRFKLELYLQVEGVERLIPMNTTIQSFYDKDSRFY